MKGLISYGLHALQAGEYAAAAVALSRVVRFSDALDHRAALGMALAGLGKHRHAIAILADCFARDRTRIDVAVSLGELHLARNDFRAACEALSAACALDPEYLTPHGTKARLLAVRAVKMIAASHPK